MSEATISNPSTKMAADAVVSVRDLQVEFPTQIGVVRALNGVTFDVPRGRVLGIVGESGSGKSVTARAILRIIERPGRIVNGDILFRPGVERKGGGRATRRNRGRTGAVKETAPEAGTANGDDTATGQAPADNSRGVVDLTALDPTGDRIRAIRGQEISMIFQEPMTSLNPVYTVGDQIAEAILLHQTPDKNEANKRAVDMLRRVGMPNPERIAKSYPHQLSGGMRQRAMIAMALSCTPTLLIADEPTTALDVTTEAQILELMRELQDEYGMSIMFITHSMGVVAQLCDEVVVMYLGRVVERRTGRRHLPRPQAPLHRLAAAVDPPDRRQPRNAAGGHQGIGARPVLHRSGLPLPPALSKCDEGVVRHGAAGGSSGGRQARPQRPVPPLPGQHTCRGRVRVRRRHRGQVGGNVNDVLLEVSNLKKHFPIKQGFLRRTVGHVKAVDGVNLSVNRGETFSIVGESGCGKSTTGRTILRLEEPTEAR